jgi:hypothetical protein
MNSQENKIQRLIEQKSIEGPNLTNNLIIEQKILVKKIEPKIKTI